MFNDKGSIFPITVLFSFFVMLMFIHQSNLLLMDRKFVKEIEQFFILDSLMEMASIDVEKQLEQMIELQDEVTNTLYYSEGKVYVRIIPLQDKSLKVILACSSNEGRNKVVNFYYDLEKLGVTKWYER